MECIEKVYQFSTLLATFSEFG